MIRVSLCGLATTLFDVAIYVTLIEVAGLPVGVAAFLGAAAGAIFSFFGNKLWAFRDPSPIAVRQLSAFALVCLGTWTSVAASVHVLYSLGVPYLAAKAIAAILVFACWSYPAQVRFVFPQPVRS